MVVSPKYAIVLLLREGVGRVELDGKLGLLDPTGREVVPPEYDNTIKRVDLGKGLFRVKRSGKEFYIKVFRDRRVVEYYDEE